MREFDVESVAKGLSEAMRGMLIRSCPQHLNESPRCWGPANTRQALRERGLGHGDYVYLTPLGLAVRAYLLEQSK